MCKWFEAQGAEGQQQTSVRRSGVQRSGIIDRSPVLHVYASVAEIELLQSSEFDCLMITRYNRIQLV